MRVSVSSLSAIPWNQQGGEDAGMAGGDEPIRVGSRPPFAVPPQRRDPARRLRGRLVAPVTVWTAGHPPGGAGLIDPTSALLEAAQETGAFVVHVLAAADRALAERFGEVRPPVRGPFERLEVAESPWGPVLGGARPRAACRLAGSSPVGHAELIEGVIELVLAAGVTTALAWSIPPMMEGGTSIHDGWNREVVQRRQGLRLHPA
jgi:3-hydroxy-9,10-secoandrosta-1,3,5(10)-triene-9,17-dione monooxygenase reductase component